ncbi:MAG: nucleotidyltransferase family protein [Vicinamibacterales bacterium]
MPETLLACLHGDDGADRCPDWRAVVILATEQRVAALLLERLESAGRSRLLPPGIRAELTARGMAIAAANLHYLVDLGQVLSALSAVGVPAVVLKGAHLARSVYPNPALREMNDVDLLIRLADAARATRALQALGYDFVARCEPDKGLVGTHHFPRLVKAGAAPLELHVTLTPAEFGLAIDTEGLWQRAIPLSPDSRHATLCPEDLLLHICVHSAYSHAAEFGLRPLCDVDQIVRAFPALDWDAVCRRATTWKTARGTFLTLHLAAECLGTHVPFETMSALRPADFDSHLAALVRTHLFTRKTLSVAVPIDATRAYASRSLVELMRQTYRKVFVSRAELVAQFPEARASRVPALFYARRALSLARRHLWLPMAMTTRRDQELIAMVDRRSAILRWLDAERTA